MGGRFTITSQVDRFGLARNDWSSQDMVQQMVQQVVQQMDQQLVLQMGQQIGQSRLSALSGTPRVSLASLASLELV